MKAYNRYEGIKYYFNADYKYDEEYCFYKLKHIDKETIENLCTVLGIKREASTRCLLESVIPRVGELLNLEKEFSYQDLFYAIYEKKLEENNISRVKLYDFNKLVETVNKNITDNNSHKLNAETLAIISLQKNKLAKIITNYFLKDFKTQG